MWMFDNVHYVKLSGGAVLSYLRGTWRVHRELHDQRSGRRGLFVGAARVDGAMYVEEGELTFGAHRGRASQVRLLKQLDANTVDVRFADGRAFYRLQLLDGGWRAQHPCAEDLYTVVGTLTGPDSFTEVWRATGPTTEFTSVTRFTRFARSVLPGQGPFPRPLAGQH
jgi:uncharacterized protein DUF6314